MSLSAEPADWTRDVGRGRAARTATLLVFGVNGFAFATWMARVPDVKDLLDLTPGQLSLLLLAISVGSLCGLPVAGRIAHRIGAANTVLLGMGVSLPGLIGAGIAVEAHAPIPVLMVPLFLVGLGIGGWDVAQNLEGSIVEQALGRSVMPWFHAGFSGGTVVGALVGALLTWLAVPVGVHIGVAAAAGMVAVVPLTRRFLPAYDEGATEAVPTGGKARSPWLEPRTLLIGLMVLAAAFTEGVANDWMAVAFVDGHETSNALGVVALAVFLSFMTAGRIVGTGLLDRFGRIAVLRVMFATAIVGCALVVFGPPWLAFIGVAVWGVGASLGFPVGMSAAADDPARAAVRLSVVSTIGYGAFLIGPPLIGFLGDRVGVLDALLAVGVVSLVAILVVPAARPLEAERAEA
ncbi:MFS transporter [Demequina sp. SYSU T00039]|uniref:MFS transporter n=1 Tax=Demequina lignilytica TaxID=3051663 RepID=A0AAW7M3N3_9MICO|nr:MULTISPECIES: MFS transporter [unclassified Demequina]MDN4477856.1 MFS transporter [Demequina sp. SYSU T00039-1]MDN4487765.1 MFS transporter [Demequina sp. SYSU T00039]MDN4490852.1 MFS transporter [Demequina sp. SYSU T00068]